MFWHDSSSTWYIFGTSVPFFLFFIGLAIAIRFCIFETLRRMETRRLQAIEEMMTSSINVHNPQQLQLQQQQYQHVSVVGHNSEQTTIDDLPPSYEQVINNSKLNSK